jgi:hypothetical protein
MGVVWDNLPAHKSRAMHAWIQSQRSWLVADAVPTSSAKSSLALATDDLGEVMAAAHRGIERIRCAWWLP